MHINLKDGRPELVGGPAGAELKKCDVGYPEAANGQPFMHMPVKASGTYSIPNGSDINFKNLPVTFDQ